LGIVDERTKAIDAFSALEGLLCQVYGAGDAGTKASRFGNDYFHD